MLSDISIILVLILTISVDFSNIFVSSSKLSVKMSTFWVRIFLNLSDFCQNLEHFGRNCIDFGQLTTLLKISNVLVEILNIFVKISYFGNSIILSQIWGVFDKIFVITFSLVIFFFSWIIARNFISTQKKCYH